MWYLRYCICLFLLWRYRVLSMLVSMRGKEYIAYNIQDNREIRTSSLHVVFKFKTIDPSGLLLFSRNTHAGDFISVEMLDGKLQYKGRLGADEDGEQSMIVGEGLNDHKWHVVNIILKERNVTIELDYKKHSKSFSKNGEFKVLDLTEKVYVGGVSDRVDVSTYRITRRRYSGCMKNFMFNGTDMLYNAKFSRPNYMSAGNLMWDKCEDIDYQPIMFNNPQDHALLPTYLQNSLSVSFRFRTHIGKGLMFSKISQMVSVILSLDDGSLFLKVVIGRGKGPIVRKQGVNLDDGFWHRVEILVDKTIITLKLDDSDVLTHENPFSNLVSFHQSNATLGGGDEYIMQGFVGCMYDIWVDNTPIDYKQLHPSYSVGVIKKCELQDRCLLSPCQHGGKCAQDHKSFRCDCVGTMYSGERCEKSIYQPNCQSYKDLGLNEDAYCMIDPDGDSTEIKPFPVLCNMTRDSKKATTIFQRDQQGQIPVSQGVIEDGELHHDIDYKHINVEMFDVLMKNAIHCRQYVKFKCRNAHLMNSPRGPPDTVWIGRGGNNERYWGGAPADSGMCACGKNRSCALPYKYCNCDTGDDVWRSDEGFLEQTERLPVLMLTFKLSANRSSFTVGNLECQYNSIAIPQNLSKIRILKACTPLNRKPTTRTLVTNPPLNQKESIWNWRRRPNKPFGYDNQKPTKHAVLPIVPKVNVNVSLEIPELNHRTDKPQDGLKFTLSVYAVIVIAVATVIVVIIIAVVVIAKRCHRSSSGNSSSSSRRRRNRHDDSMDTEDEEQEDRTEMCTFFGSFSRAGENNRPVIEVHRHSIHCDTLDALPPAYREYADYANQPITTHIDLSYKPRKKSFGFFC